MLAQQRKSRLRGTGGQKDRELPEIVAKYSLCKIERGMLPLCELVVNVLGFLKPQ